MIFWSFYSRSATPCYFGQGPSSIAAICNVLGDAVEVALGVRCRNIVLVGIYLGIVLPLQV